MWLTDLILVVATGGVLRVFDVLLLVKMNVVAIKR